MFRPRPFRRLLQRAQRPICLFLSLQRVALRENPRVSPTTHRYVRGDPLGAKTRRRVLQRVQLHTDILPLFTRRSKRSRRIERFRIERARSRVELFTKRALRRVQTRRVRHLENE